MREQTHQNQTTRVRPESIGASRHLHDLKPRDLLLPFGRGIGFWVVLVLSVLLARPAHAVPSFAQQTGQPCQACHVSAFGPQLKPYGRDFKLYGYQSSDGKSHEPPVALMALASLTHTQASAPTPPAPHFGDNDNFAVDQISAFYAGRLPQGWGAFAQATYDGVAHGFSIDNVDVRRASEVTLLGRDSVFGIDFNNNPTIEDAWNSTPAWGFPYNGSALAPAAAASSLLDGGLSHTVVGGGGYVMWDDTVYLAAMAYLPMERRFAGRLGEGTGFTSDRFSGVIPYWRAALIHDIGASETFQVGALGLRAERYPAGDVSHGTDAISDFGLDGTWQHIGTTHVLSAHAIWMHEDQDLKASAILSGTNPKNHLNTTRADLSYSYADTWTPSVQLFRTSGTADPAQYAGGTNTEGYVLELAYVPWGKPNSPLYWLNARLGLQYVGYTEFNGSRSHASDNNTLYANIWFAVAPFGSKVRR